MVIFGKIQARELGRQEASEILGLSLRQVHRLYLRFVGEGDAGLMHRSRGRASPLRIDAAERERALERYRTHYRGFGPTLWAEKLAERDGIWISHDTARRWLLAEGLLERGRRGRRSRRRRERKERFGQMVQMDGSPHAWFGPQHPPCVLMTVIDDATSRRRGRFYEAETLAAAMDCFGRWCGRFGVPSSLYVDQHGIYRSDREASIEELRAGTGPVTQFGRAMHEMGVELIRARSPQAKGRVERSNGVVQDRLPKELALAGVAGIEPANAWLEASRFFEKLDEKFAVEPAEEPDAHRPLVVRLEDVLCVKEKRSVGLDGCVQWLGRVLQLESPGTLKSVEVWERFDGTLQVLGDGRRLSWREISPQARREQREARQRGSRKPIQNNKVVKPGPRQQIHLGRPSRPASPGSPGPCVGAGPR